MFTVSKEPGSDFTSIGAALAALESNPELPRTIFIKNGIYKERLEIRLSDLKLIGEDREHTIITEGFGANMAMPDGSKRGTFRSYTMLLDADRITLENLTIENTAGDGRTAGQAIALYADGDELVIRGCRLLGHQDTLFTGPLPPTEKQRGGFIGPKEFAPRIVGRQYYRDCYIEGDVDFIFGGACALFENCEIRSLNRGEEVNGYATAASTPEGEPIGYVFYRCRFTGDCPQGTVYLGRPWREFAKTVMLCCDLGSHIRADGWHDWNKPEAHEHALYAEYGCTGAGADTSSRPSWIRLFDQEDADACVAAVRRRFSFCPDCCTENHSEGGCDTL